MLRHTIARKSPKQVIYVRATGSASLSASKSMVCFKTKSQANIISIFPEFRSLLYPVVWLLKRECMTYVVPITLSKTHLTKVQSILLGTLVNHY